MQVYFNKKQYTLPLSVIATFMEIEKPLINDRFMFQKYPENFSPQLFITAIIYPENVQLS